MLLRVKQLKSKSITSKQNQIKYKKGIKHCYQEQKYYKVSLIQINRIKSSIKWYKTLASRPKVLKSNSYTNKQNQIKCKMV